MTESNNGNTEINNTLPGALAEDKLVLVLSKMLGKNVARAHFQAEQLAGGTVGDVRLVTGSAETADGDILPYKVVLKVQRKWERGGDPGSWRREYDLYMSDLASLFTDSFRWAECYHAQMNEEGNETQLWMEYIDGVSGRELTLEMLEKASEELGRFQGKLYKQQTESLKDMSCFTPISWAGCAGSVLNI